MSEQNDVVEGEVVDEGPGEFPPPGAVGSTPANRLNARRCPDCNYGIGNNRTKCKTCNAFAQRVRRRALSMLSRRHKEEYKKIVEHVEFHAWDELNMELS